MLTLSAKCQPGIRRARRLQGAALACSLLLAACATAPVATPEEQVQQRASERWAALVKRDFSKAYAFTSPAYREKVDAETYQERTAQGSWSAAEVVKVTCPDPAQCNSTVRVEFKNPLARKFGDSISTHVEENWLLVDGAWYLSQK